MVRLMNIIVPALQQQPTVRQQQQQEQQPLKQPCRHMHVPLVFMNTIKICVYVLANSNRPRKKCIRAAAYFVVVVQLYYCTSTVHVQYYM